MARGWWIRIPRWWEEYKGNNCILLALLAYYDTLVVKSANVVPCAPFHEYMDCALNFHIILSALE